MFPLCPLSVYSCPFCGVTPGWSVRKVEYETIAGRMPAPYRFSARCLLYSRREIEQFVAARDAALAAEAEANTAAKAARQVRRKAAVAAALRKTA